MKDHGKKAEDMYPTMPENRIVHPPISLPAEVFDKEESQPGHKCMLKIEVEIETMSKDMYHCKLLKSEEVEDKKD